MERGTPSWHSCHPGPAAPSMAPSAQQQGEEDYDYKELL